MFDFQTKKKIRRFLYSPLVAGLVVVLALYSLYSTWQVYGKYETSKHALDTAEAHLLELNKQDSNLSASVSELETPAGVDKEIREKYGLAKPDESMAIIEDDSATGTATTTTSFWSKLLHLFGI